MRKCLFILCFPILSLAACSGESSDAEEGVSTETETKSAPVIAAEPQESEMKRLAPADEQSIIEESEEIDKKAESAGNLADSILNSL